MVVQLWHLLIECDGTHVEATKFFDEVAEISMRKQEECLKLPTLRSRAAWVLAGGTCKGELPFAQNSHRIKPQSSPIQQGRSVTPIKDKTDPVQCYHAYLEYRDILHNLEQDHIRVYTDGSRSTETGISGYGLRILHQTGSSVDTIYEKAAGLGQATIQQAELSAIREALFWIVQNSREKNLPVHILTDSKYCYNTCTEHEIRRKNFYLLQEIQNFAHRLQIRNITCTLHWLPSHIENTFIGKRYTGNYYADKLATDGQALSKPEDCKNQVRSVRERLLTAVIEFVNTIENKLELLNSPPNGPSAHADDLSARTDANRNPEHRIP